MSKGLRMKRFNGATRRVPKMLPAAIAPGISPKASTPIPRDWAQRMINLSYIQMISIETVAVPITKGQDPVGSDHAHPRRQIPPV